MEYHGLTHAQKLAAGGQMARLSSRIPKADKIVLTALAEGRGVTVSALVRTWVLDQLSKHDLPHVVAAEDIIDSCAKPNHGSTP